MKTSQPVEAPIGCRPAQAQKLIGVGKTRMAELIRTGQVESILIGRTRIVKVESLRRLLDEAA